jgi:hypothetical protein
MWNQQINKRTNHQSLYIFKEEKKKRPTNYVSEC